MKLLFDAGGLREPLSAAGVFCRQFGLALAKLPTAQTTTFLVPPGQTGVFGEGATYRPAAWYDQLWRSDEFAIWHGVWPYVSAQPASRTKFVLTISDVAFLERPDLSASQKATRLRELQRNVSKAAAVAVPSEYVANVVRARLELNPNQPLRVISPGLPPAADATLSGMHGQMPDAPFFLFLGRITPEKQLHTLLPLLEAFPDYKLVLAGPDDHPYAQHLRQQTETIDVANRLLMPGAVDEPTKTWLFAHCEAFLHPSPVESFGYSALEAMRVDKPVFLSSAGALPEAGGPAAFYWNSLEPDDVVNTFLTGMQSFNDDTLRADQLRWQAKKFTWERTVKAYQALYAEVG